MIVQQITHREHHYKDTLMRRQCLMCTLERTRQAYQCMFHKLWLRMEGSDSTIQGSINLQQIGQYFSIGGVVFQ